MHRESYLEQQDGGERREGGKVNVRARGRMRARNLLTWPPDTAMRMDWPAGSSCLSRMVCIT